MQAGAEVSSDAREVEGTQQVQQLPEPMHEQQQPLVSQTAPGSSVAAEPIMPPHDATAAPARPAVSDWVAAELELHNLRDLCKAEVARVANSTGTGVHTLLGGAAEAEGALRREAQAHGAAASPKQCLLARLQWLGKYEADTLGKVAGAFKRLSHARDARDRRGHRAGGGP